MSLRYFASNSFQGLSLLCFPVPLIWHEHSYVHLYKYFKKMWVYVYSCLFSILKSSVKEVQTLVEEMRSSQQYQEALGWCAVCCVSVLEFVTIPVWASHFRFPSTCPPVCPHSPYGALYLMGRSIAQQLDKMHAIHFIIEVCSGPG